MFREDIRADLLFLLPYTNEERIDEVRNATSVDQLAAIALELQAEFEASSTSLNTAGIYDVVDTLQQFYQLAEKSLIDEVLSSWEPGEERRLINELRLHISRIPNSIAGVSVSHVRTEFENYLATMTGRYSLLLMTQTSIDTTVQLMEADQQARFEDTRRQLLNLLSDITGEVNEEHWEHMSLDTIYELVWGALRSRGTGEHWDRYRQIVGIVGHPEEAAEFALFFLSLVPIVGTGIGIIESIDYLLQGNLAMAVVNLGLNLVGAGDELAMLRGTAGDLIGESAELASRYGHLVDELEGLADDFRRMADDLVTAYPVYRVRPWSEIDMNIFPVALVDEAAGMLPMRDITNFVRETLGIPAGQRITLSDFERFMSLHHWSHVIDGVHYPVEMSAAFDENGFLIEAWAGRTILDDAGGEYTSYAGSLPIGTVRYTHWHPVGPLPLNPAANAWFSASYDMSYFVGRRLQYMDAVSTRYTFTVRWEDETWAGLQTLSVQDQGAVYVEVRNFVNRTNDRFRTDLSTQIDSSLVPEFDAGTLHRDFPLDTTVLLSNNRSFELHLTYSITPR